jgi:hypothetical protein
MLPEIALLTILCESRHIETLSLQKIIKHEKPKKNIIGCNFVGYNNKFCARKFKI